MYNKAFICVEENIPKKNYKNEHIIIIKYDNSEEYTYEIHVQITTRHKFK